MMRMVKKLLSGSVLGICLLTLSLVISGCVTTGTNSTTTTNQGTNTSPAPRPDDKLRIGDLISITFQNAIDLKPHEERIKEDGTITLPHINAIKAVGLSAGELQRNIHTAYVPKYYPNLVVVVRAEDRFFFVDGEVKIPNRYVYVGQQTVLRAIATAQGFTDFADRKKVELTRVDGKKFIIDANKAQNKSELDLPVYPGDRILVKRRFW
jgi:polysaccharide biosynthesis/export protein VpsN